MRLGHMAHKNIAHLQQNVDGVEVVDKKVRKEKNNPNTLCEVCNTAISHTKISRQKQHTGETPFQWTHIDLIHEEMGLSGERYIFHFYCQLTKFNIAFVTVDRKQKTLVNCFMQAHNMIRKWGYDIQFVRMDQEAGLKSEFNDYCLQHGIWLEKTTTANKESNGAAERSGGWIITVSRKLGLESGLPNYLWPYFVLAAVRILNRILNRTPKKSLNYKTPFEIITKRRPDLSGYRVPGSKCYVTRKNIPSLQKQAKRSDIGYYISNSARNISVVWMPYGNKVISSRDVRVDEMSRFSWEQVRNPDIIPAFEDRFVSIEHGNPIDQLLENVIEDLTSTDIQVNKTPTLTTIPALESNFNSHNLPTPKPTPEPAPEILIESVGTD